MEHATPIVIDMEPGDVAEKRPALFTVLFPDGNTYKGYFWLAGSTGAGVRFAVDASDRFDNITVLDDESMPGMDDGGFSYPDGTELPSETDARTSLERELNREPVPTMTVDDLVTEDEAPEPPKRQTARRSGRRAAKP